MLECYKSRDFSKYFTENMNQLGLSVPSGLFDSAEKATATAILILGTIKTVGPTATMAEIAGATVALEKLAILSAVSASGYVGAVIGSIAVAIGRTVGCGTRISDLFARQEKLKFQNWELFYASNPKVINKDLPFRNSYGIRCKEQLSSFKVV